jgi:hypothetical protein
LPAGFEYPVKLVPHRDGYRLETKGVATGGPYAVRGGKLVFVGTDERQRFEWLIRSPYLLTLGDHDAANGADYTGAVLFRLSPAATLSLERETPGEPVKNASNDRPAKVRADLPVLTVEKLNAAVKEGDYTDVRQTMIGRELIGIAVVEKVAPWSNLSLQVTLLPACEFSASLFGWTNFEDLKPGDRIEFRGMMTEEAYANIAIWVSSWKKLSDEKSNNKQHNKPHADVKPKIAAISSKLNLEKLHRSSLADLLNRPGKVASGPLGFTTHVDALDRWNTMQPKQRWTGELAKTIAWDQIERIHILDLAMHLRSKADIDEFLKPILAAATLVEQKPERFPDKPKSGRYGVMLQALLDLENGESALITIGNSHPNWLVVEYQSRVGLAMLKK